MWSAVEVSVSNCNIDDRERVRKTLLDGCLNGSNADRIVLLEVAGRMRTPQEYGPTDAEFQNYSTILMEVLHKWPSLHSNVAEALGALRLSALPAVKLLLASRVRSERLAGLEAIVLMQPDERTVDWHGNHWSWLFPLMPVLGGDEMELRGYAVKAIALHLDLCGVPPSTGQATVSNQCPARSILQAVFRFDPSASVRRRARQSLNFYASSHPEAHGTDANVDANVNSATFDGRLLSRSRASHLVALSQSKRSDEYFPERKDWDRALFLLPGLESTDGMVRLQTVNAISRLMMYTGSGEDAFGDALMETLRLDLAREPSARVRSAAKSAIGRMDAEKSRHPFEEPRHLPAP